MKNILRLFFVVILTQFVIAQTPNFEGVIYSGEVPPDPVIAVSSDYIVQAVNKKIAVFNKSGTKLSEESFSSFFQNQSPPSSIFDPKVAYDQYSNRFILLAGGKNTNGGNSNYMLAVTQNADPTGSWYKYKLTAEDQNLTQYDIDFPGLGYDEEAIYLTSHQFYSEQGSYYPKITILNKSEIYSGTNTYRKDFKDFSSGGSSPAKLKPMRKFGTSNGYFLVNTESAGQIRIWKIVNPLGGSDATLSSVATKTLGSYSSISEASQKGTTNKVDIGDYSVSDVVCKDGYLYGAYTAQNTTSNGSMIVYFKVNTYNNYNLDINGKIENENKYYYYPVLHPDNDGSIVFVFNKSSSDDYIGVAWTIRYAGNSNIEPIQWLKQGTTWYYHLLNDENRWGDYCGIALDPANAYGVWICGEWAYSNTEWRTQIGEISTGQTTDFTFTNTIFDENTGILNDNAGGTINVNSTPVNSGNILPLVTGNSYTEKTNNERFPNWNSLDYTYKHNHWNEALDSKFLSNNLEANPSNTDQRAFFRSLNYSKIEVKLEGQLIENQGAGEFQDPWYVLSNGSQPGNYWIDFNSYYEPNGKEGATEQGVFLDQSGPPLWNPPYYSVNSPDFQPITVNGETHKFFLQNWSSTGATFQNSSAAQTGVVFTSGNAVVTANLKGQLISKDGSGFSNNGQRKVVFDGTYYHSVYTSQNLVWYTKSTSSNFNGDWTKDEILYASVPAKNPSIDVYQNNIGVVAELEDGYIVLSENGVMHQDELIYIDPNYYGNAYPVISRTANEFLIIYKPSATSVLKYRRYYLSSTGWVWTAEADLPNSTSNSKYPTIAGDKTLDDVHIAWQEGTTQIKYLFSHKQGTDRVFSNFSTVSSGSGYTSNTNPSISLNSDGPFVSWTGSRKENNPNKIIGKETLVFVYRAIIRAKAGSWGDFHVLGENVNYTNNNSTLSANGETVIAYSRDNGQLVPWAKRVGGYYTAFGSLSHNGLQVNLSNGTNISNLKAMVFNTSTLPYPINRSTTDFTSSIPKITTGEDVTYGRTGVVGKQDIEFVFSLEDILLDDVNIEFTSRADTIPVLSLEELNSAARSTNFNLEQNSALYFSLYYLVINPELASTVLSENDYVRFKLELVKTIGDQVVGTFDDITFTRDNVYDHENTSYKVDCTGIESGSYYLRIVADANSETGLSIANSQNDAGNLSKTNYTEVGFTGETSPLTYELSQNYPNPFNPSTTIKYQIPEPGLVTIIIYDILGREVTTLVDKFKNEGRYEVNFNASNLASGVYIYTIRSNDFSASKKLLLLK